MSRYIVRYTGKGAPPAGALDGIAAASGVRVVDRTGRMLLVDADDEDHVRAATSGCGGGAANDWLIAQEVTYAPPDLRKRIRRPPEAGAEH